MSASSKVAEVAFGLLPDQRVRAPAVDIPDDTIEIQDRDLIGAGAVDAALMIVATAPSFDRYSANEIGGALGDSVYAVVSGGQLDNPIFVTSEDFDPTERVSRKNAPFEASDILPRPGSTDGTLEYTDWPTGGPLFQNESGMEIQIETREIEDELSPDVPDSRSGSGQDLPRTGFDNRFENRMETPPSEGELNPGQNVPDSPGDMMGETPETWPGADDVFRTIAPQAARLAANGFSEGQSIQDAATISANNVLDEWLGYTGDMRRQAEEALTNWLIERVFEGNYEVTQFRFDPPQLPVDTEMREMALRFIDNDLQGQVRDDKIQDAKRLFLQEATDPLTGDMGAGVRDLLEFAFDEAGVDIPNARARRFNPDDQRAVGGAAGADSMDVVWPRGIDEQEVSNVGAIMSDQGYDRELYGPLTAEQLPTDPMLLKRLAGIMEDFAETRADRGDHDGHGFYLRLAGLMYQALDQQR